jgi:hypothetical protein
MDDGTFVDVVDDGQDAVFDEPSYASRVARYAVVGIVTSHHLGQMGMLIAQGSMPIVSAPIALSSCLEVPRPTVDWDTS